MLSLRGNRKRIEVLENELRSYQMYIKPLEELVKEISDKILAGFLYSKIVSAKPYIKVDVQVKSLDIISSISEHSLIEIIGTLVDNAFEAATEELCNVGIVLEASGNKLVFEISNETRNLTLEQVSHFFDKGYTTKEDKSSEKFGEKHGFGLYNARKISKKYGGDVTVSLENLDDRQLITFRVEI